MVEYRYCPVCDRLVAEQEGHCKKCKTRIVRFSVRSDDAIGALIVLIFVMTFGSVFVLMLMSGWAGFLFFIAILGLALLVGVRTNNHIKKRGKALFLENRIEYERGKELDFTGQEMALEIPPWNISHNKDLLIGSVLCIVLIPVILFILYYNDVESLWWGFFSGTLFLISAFLYLSHKPGSRFIDVIEAFELKPGEYSFKIWRTMTVDAPRYGPFSLYYDTRYKLWITTEKQIGKEGRKRTILWRRSGLMKRLLGKQDRLPDYLSMARLREIKSLQSIRLEKGKQGNRFAAMLNDKLLYSEARDIEKTLEMLRDIEARI